MNYHTSTLYPMMAVGAFMTMFWTGVVVGHELGLSCFSLLVTGLLSGCIATVLVSELERRDRYGSEGRRRPVSPSTGVISQSIGSQVAVRRKPARDGGSIVPIGVGSPASGARGA